MGDSLDRLASGVSTLPTNSRNPQAEGSWRATHSLTARRLALRARAAGLAGGLARGGLGSRAPRAPRKPALDRADVARELALGREEAGEAGDVLAGEALAELADVAGERLPARAVRIDDRSVVAQCRAPRARPARRPGGGARL